MINFNVMILGNGSAVPTSFSNPSAQLLSYENKHFLIDCGEGTQMQMIKYKVKHANIQHVLISHLHGDHFYGLMGMISTFHLYGRDKALHIYAPKALEGLINHHLDLSQTKLRYPLHFHQLETIGDQALYEDKLLKITCFPLTHKIPTWGFRFCEKQKRPRINKEFVEDYKPSICDIRKVKEGADYTTDSGEVLKNQDICLPISEPRSYAYCSDTAYFPEIIANIKGVSLLYHEATFSNEMEKIAGEKFHSTAAQAAKIAKGAGAESLLLGHFSARFKDTSVLLEEARVHFPNTTLSKEGETYNIV